MSFLNLSGFHSPPSRPLIIPSPTSPFCTSPSQLQEVTLDQDNTFSNSMGLRSPGGPMRGRSVKEFEEQLTNVKKENFNLKLRIYFLEERMGVNFNLDKENIVKKNVELMVEVESLRKEVQEKHDLLCQAVKAMELEDEENKKMLCEKDDAITDCHQEIENLKSQLLDIKAESEISAKNYQSELFTNAALTSPDALKQLQEKIESLEEELGQEKQNSAAIQIIMDQNDAKISTLSSQLDEATKQLASKEEELQEIACKLDEAKAKYQGAHKRLLDKTQLVEELSAENEELRRRQSLTSGDLEKERKRYEKLKASADQKTADLQCKLEASLAELKKSQELVVSKSPGRRPGNTDADSFSVQKPAASPGSPQKDTFVLPTVPSPVITPTSSPSPSVNFAFDNAIELKHIIERLKSERDAQHQKIVKLKAEQMKACKIIKSMIDSRNKTNDEIVALKQKNEDLERELDEAAVGGQTEGSRGSEVATSSTSSCMPNENSMDEQSGELIEHYKALTDELDEKNRILTVTLNEKNIQMKKLQEQYEEMLENIKEKEEHIVDLEFELLTLAQDKNGTSREIDSDKVENYTKQLQQKEEEIKRLNSKLLKKNFDLQGLVNNELWDKNREIEKLLKKQGSKLLESKDQEIEQLQNDLKTKEEQLGFLKDKICELGFAIDVEGGDVNIENNLQAELEKSEKLRLEANEVCAVLSTRLEELAVFLDSLLRQKSVLGLLGHGENKRLRQIIDQSLDLSRSFTMSILLHPEQSLLQLTNISSLLNDTQAKEPEGGDCEDEDNRLSLVPTNVSLTFKNHHYKTTEEENAQIIQTLRQQIINLKYELQLRDVELNKMNICTNLTEGSSTKEEELVKSVLNTTSTTLKYKSDNQSESEAWSEPDRSVSRARIGLLDASLRSALNKKANSNTSTDSTEDEEMNRSSKGSSKKGLLSESRYTILDLHKQVCDLDQKLNDKESAYCEVTKINGKLRQEVANLEIKLIDTERKLHDAEKKKEQAENDVQLSEAKFKQLEQEKQVLLESQDKKDVESYEMINQLEIEKVRALEAAKEAEVVAEIANNEMMSAEMKLREVQQQMDDLEMNLKRDYEDRLHVIEEKSLEKIKEIQNETELEIKSLRSTIQQIHVEYATNYVKKCRVEEAVEEIERLRNEIESFEEQIEIIQSEKEHVSNKLAEYEDKVNLLRNDLDNATLQYSEAVLEKTKIANEKALIEQELNKHALREVDTKRKFDQIENELYELRQNHQKQVSALQTQKSMLEVRVSELESSNAELHNRLVKIQAGCGDHVTTSTSLPNTPNFVNQIVSFRRQHSENSCYLSEDHILDDGRTSSRILGSRLMPNQNFDIERNEANSSPDLGIESDHGRFSSLETHVNVQRPLLQTLELTESMSNLLDVENNDSESGNCDDAHCCQRTIEMAHENSDLKRKLLRTRRALEETVTQLTLANQRKKQVEKTICRQIHKTSQVLRKAKANLDSGSETDVYKK